MTAFQDPDGATPLSPDERNGLKLRDITFRHELNQAEYDNIAKAEAWAWRRLNTSKRVNILTEDFLRALHKRMFGDVWAWAGTYSKEINRRIGHDRPLIPQAVHDLLADAAVWCRLGNMPMDEIAVRFHWQLTKIHAFPNGNGRHARMMADLLLYRLGGTAFTWGVAGERQGLWAQSETRRRYIAALRAADQHDLTAILAFARS